MLTGFEGVGKAHVGHDREAEGQPRVDRDDHLGDRGHADHIGSDRPEEPVLGAGLQVRSGHRHVDTALGRDVRLERGLQGQVLECPVVGLDHVREPRAEPFVVGTDQGVEAQEVDVVLDHHHVPFAILGVQPPASVRDDQERHPISFITRIGKVTCAGV